MRFSSAVRLVVAALLVAVALVVVRAQDQQAPVFRGSTETVPVYVTVTDKDARLVTSLAREDFTVLDNGKPQPITVFDNTPQPIRLIVMLDVSGSMYGNLGLLRQACRELLARLRPDDRVRVGSFGEEIAISPEFTKDPASLDAALPSIIPDSAPTPLWQAVDKAIDGFEKDGGRRVILVLSDGKDAPRMKFGGPTFSLPQEMERAQKEEVMVYSVGLRSRAAPGRRPFGAFNPAQAMLADMPDPGLATLALETGGGYFELRPRDDLDETFAQAVDELHAQYLLGFVPPSRDGKKHKVEVKLSQHDLKARARKNYVAPSAK